LIRYLTVENPSGGVKLGNSAAIRLYLRNYLVNEQEHASKCSGKLPLGHKLTWSEQLY